MKRFKTSAKRWDRDFPWVKAEDRDPTASREGLPVGSVRLMSYDGRGNWTDHGEVPASMAHSARSADVVVAEPLELAQGCARCGEPMDKRARFDTCSPCLKQIAEMEAAILAELSAEVEASRRIAA